MNDLSIGKFAESTPNGPTAPTKKGCGNGGKTNSVFPRSHSPCYLVTIQMKATDAKQSAPARVGNKNLLELRILIRMKWTGHSNGLCASPKSHPRQWVDWFKSLLDKDLNNPPTTVGGIPRLPFVPRRNSSEPSTHCRGWDF